MPDAPLSEPGGGNLADWSAGLQVVDQHTLSQLVTSGCLRHNTCWMPDLFFATFRGTPTAKAEGLDRIGG